MTSKRAIFVALSLLLATLVYGAVYSSSSSTYNIAEGRGGGDPSKLYDCTQRISSTDPQTGLSTVTETCCPVGEPKENCETCTWTHGSSPSDKDYMEICEGGSYSYPEPTPPPTSPGGVPSDGGVFEQGDDPPSRPGDDAGAPQDGGVEQPPTTTSPQPPNQDDDGTGDGNNDGGQDGPNSQGDTNIPKDGEVEQDGGGEDGSQNDGPIL